MAKTKTDTAPVSKPRTSFDLGPKTALPTVGDLVTIAVAGKVVSASEEKRSWEKDRVVRSVALEYEGPESVIISTGGAQEKHGRFTRKMIDAMSEEKQAMMKKAHPDVWRWYLGGPYK